jgi:FKBP-type peptidyl-prolyl cis-trans isomerase SlyD
MKEGQVVSDGLVVSLDYVLKVDGDVVDTTRNEGDAPIQFIQGAGQIIPRLEVALQGMMIGESKKVLIPPPDAYGEFDPDAFEMVATREFPPSIPIKVGTQIEIRDESGETLMAHIAEIEGDQVRLDFNHPLAGKELDFVVEVVNLRDATEEEKAHGHVHGEEQDEDQG